MCLIRKKKYELTATKNSEDFDRDYFDDDYFTCKSSAEEYILEAKIE